MIRLKVLVVDDIAANRKLLAAFLARIGCDSIAAANGREGIELFKAEQPDVVIMDRVMPEMDGLEATRLIKEAAGERWVPVLVLSALDTEDDIIAGLAAGADDYLTKPLSFSLFAAKFTALGRLLEKQKEFSGGDQAPSD
jgi:DNA-binding response OmpR family regulator